MSQDTQPPTAEGPKKKKKSGCLALVVIVALVIIVIAFATSGDDEDEPTVAEPPASSEPAEKPSKAPEPEETTEEPEPEKTEEPEEKGADAKEWAAAIEADLKDGLGGVKEFAETCPDVSWACAIADISATNVGTLNVTEQVDGLTKDEAEKAATNIFNFVGEQHEDLNWVVIYGPDGVVVGQVQRDNVPMLN